MKNIQQLGGLAALCHTTALAVGMALSFTVMYPLLEATPDQAQVFLADHQTLARVWAGIVDGGTAFTLVILVLALYQRLNAGATVLTLVASALGLLWAGLIVANSGLMLLHFGVVPNLYGSDPAQVAALTALARGLWVLTTSRAALRTGGLTRTSSYLGLVLGIVGILTSVPAITEIALMLFGPGMMVWTAWVGIVLLRHGDAMTAQRGDAVKQLSAQL